MKKENVLGNGFIVCEQYLSKKCIPEEGSQNELAPDSAEATMPIFSQEMIIALLQAGYTKKTIARELCISRESIRKILRGIVKAPRLETFSKLLGLYIVNCYWKLNK